MIKRLYNMARASLSDLMLKRKGRSKPAHARQEDEPPRRRPETERNPADPLAGYYANLELPPGSSGKEVKRAWKRLMRKYHPDLHSADPEKRKTANELTRRLTEAYRILDKELKKSAASHPL
ncbi:MAG: J domain-containing protein [Nitrospinales bacterium]